MNRRLGALHEYLEQRRLSRPRLTGDDDEALARFYAVAQAGKGLAIDRIVVKKTRIGRDTKGRPVEAKVIFVHLSHPLLAKNKCVHSGNRQENRTRFLHPTYNHS